MKVLQYPLTQITLFFVFGIVFNRYFNLQLNTGLTLLAVSFSVFLIAFLLNFRIKSQRFVYLFTSSCLLLSFSIGNFSALLHQATNDPSHYVHASNFSAENSNMKIVLLERWKSTLKNNRFTAEIYNLNDKMSSPK